MSSAGPRAVTAAGAGTELSAARRRAPPATPEPRRSRAARRAGPGVAARAPSRPATARSPPRAPRGRPIGHDQPATHHHDPREVARRELHVVGDRHHGPVCRGPRVDERADARDARPILAGRRLVEHENRRVHRQHTGERDELPVRQPQVVRVLRGPIRQPHGGECLGDEAPDVGIAKPEVARSERRLALHRAAEELAIGILEHEADGMGDVGDRPPGDVTTGNSHAAGLRGQDPDQVLGEGRLARAVLPDDGHGLAGLDGEVHPPERHLASRVAVMEPGHLDPRRRLVPNGLPGGHDPACDAGRGEGGAGRGQPARLDRSDGRRHGVEIQRHGRGHLEGGGDGRHRRHGDADTAAQRRPERRPRQVDPGHPALVQHQAPRREPEDGGLVLGRENGGPGRGSPREELGNSPRGGGIQLRGGLVEDEEPRPHAENCRDGHPLLLASRECRRQALLEVADAECREGRVDPVVHLGPGDSQVLQPEGELLANRELGARELVRRRREDDADLAEEVADGRLRRPAAGDRDAPAEARLDHPRDERRRCKCKR